MNFFDDRLRTSVDYYREHRKDILLIDGTAPGLLGFTVPYVQPGRSGELGMGTVLELERQDWR